MAIVCKFGKPDLFLTFTCNPKAKSITENLPPGVGAENRPDLVARVFKRQLHELWLWFMQRLITSLKFADTKCDNFCSFIVCGWSLINYK